MSRSGPPGSAVDANSELVARSRHPSTRPLLTCAELRYRVADSLEVLGVPHPEVAAAVLEVRGRSGLGPVAFARRAGVAVTTLARAEAGLLERDALPGAMRRMVPR